MKFLGSGEVELTEKGVVGALLGVLLWEFPEKSVGRVGSQWLYEPIGTDGTGSLFIRSFIHSFIHSLTIDSPIPWTNSWGRCDVDAVDLVPALEEVPGR